MKAIESLQSKQKNSFYSAYSPYTNQILWVLFFCYSTITAIVFQKLLLPLIPSLHGGQGLINADATKFHLAAIHIAETIKQYGWHKWSIYDINTSTTGHVAVLSALYAVFGYDPLLIIPINAILHATSGVLICKLSCLLWQGKVGFYSGIIGSILFVCFPSTVNWYAQIHKDGYVILGTLIILYSLIKNLKTSTKLRQLLSIISSSTIGTLLIAFVRPYNVKLCIFAFMNISLAMLIYLLLLGELKKKWQMLCSCLIVLVVLIAGSLVFEKYDSLKSWEGQSIGTDSGSWQWNNSHYIPDAIEKYIKTAAAVRVNIINSGITVSAKSLIDKDIMPSDVLSVVAYLPRGLLIALFAPFVSTWFEVISITRLVAAFEMLVWYLLVPGVCLTFFYNRSVSIFIIAVFSLSLLTILGFTLPNVGTLYRLRYIYLFFFILFGVMGWVYFFIAKTNITFSFLIQKNSHLSMHPKNDESFFSTLSCPINSLYSRNGIAKSGVIVMLLTGLSYIGFFIRDAIMARLFGLGQELDAFFVAIAIPMFLVALLSMPFGNSITPVFFKIKENNSIHDIQRFIHCSSFYITFLLLCVCIILYLISSAILPMIGWGFSAEKLHFTANLMNYFIMLLLFSGILITGNSVLNALTKSEFVALAQIAVPIISIITTLILGQKIGVTAVAIGMIIGQLINLLLVAYKLKSIGYSLIPKFLKETYGVGQLLSQYLWLVCASFFTNVAMLVNNAMASSLSAGSVAALNLGNKFVLFITGIIGTAIIAVVLPYFCSFIAKKHLFRVKKELSFFLFIVTILSIPTSILFYYASNLLVKVAFVGGVFSENDALTVSTVMQLGVIQFPFFTCNVLLSNYVTASNRTQIVLLASIIALACNVGLNVFLMKAMGVAGISLSITLALMLSTIILMLVAYTAKHIHLTNVILIIFIWLMYLTLVLCMHYRIYTGVFIVCLALIFLIISNWKFILLYYRKYSQSL